MDAPAVHYATTSDGMRIAYGAIAQIAEALLISPNTLARHVSNIFDKLGLENRAAATAYVLRNGLA